MSAQIIKCERVGSPAVRFIGKRCDGYPNWGEFFANGWFDKIEESGDRAAINDDSYCVLYGKPDADGKTEHYLGEFFSANTPVPDDFDAVDLAPFEAVMFYIKGKQGDCYELAGERDKLISAAREQGIELSRTDGRFAGFERDNCPRFTSPDENGDVILDFALFM